MILCYHKVSSDNPTHWWVTADAFDRQLADLRAYEVVTLDDYDPHDPDHAVITFDGPYADVARFAAPLLRKWGYPFELFVIGDWIGRENTFDQHVEPPARFAGMDDLRRLVDAGGRLQWHSRSHGVLASLSDDGLAAELEPPSALRAEFTEPHFSWFAYPHGETDPRVAAHVRERFRGAVSVLDGTPEDRYSLPRREISETSRLSRSTVSLMIANYNYGRFLPQAVDSVLSQSRAPDELIIIDDGSTDTSPELLDRYRDRATVISNGTNQGIVPTFRRAVESSSGDYLAFLGADNRLRSDFVERCKAALDADPDAAVAYTDVALFGPRSHILAGRVGAAPTLAEDVYLWRFPDPTPEALSRLETENFLHGSSMYRRTDYEAVGGYRQAGGPEDHDLFRRMLATGRRSVHVREPVLEYRQHSGEQANTLLVAQLETAHWLGEARRLSAALEASEVRATALAGELAAVAADRDAARSQTAAAQAQAATANGEVDHVRADLENATARIAALEPQAAALAAVYAGGWWRLRSRLQPLLGPAAMLARQARSARRVPSAGRR